jgi:hypothetical protein
VLDDWDGSDVDRLPDAMRINAVARRTEAEPMIAKFLVEVFLGKRRTRSNPRLVLEHVPDMLPFNRIRTHREVHVDEIVGFLGHVHGFPKWPQRSKFADTQGKPPDIVRLFVGRVPGVDSVLEGLVHFFGDRVVGHTRDHCPEDRPPVDVLVRSHHVSLTEEGFHLGSLSWEVFENAIERDDVLEFKH